MTTWSDSNADAAHYLDRYVRARGFHRARILDFGCGAGSLVSLLRALGHEAHGCDTWTLYDVKPPANPLLQEIRQSPYRLPFDGASFDFVVSTSVLEHAQNKDECFHEIRRVLVPGGHAVHFVPGKWYLPVEPHIGVPFVSWLWPNVPRWWLGLWALLGIRNEYQQGKPWRAVRETNAAYVARGLSYWSTVAYREASERIFGEWRDLTANYLQHGIGGAARLARALPGLPIATLSRECRMGVFAQIHHATAAVSAV